MRVMTVKCTSDFLFDNERVYHAGLCAPTFADPNL